MSKASWANGKSYDDGPHYVYRLYDAADQLLYIGCSADPNRRVKAHRSASAFGSLIARVRITGPFPGWGRAHQVELAAVWDEMPAYNIEGARPEARLFAQEATRDFLLERHLRLVREGRRAS